jgi:rhodanese-related sulfurtransferase
MAHQVFISHARTDFDTADLIRKSLEENGIDCWIAPRDVVPGAPFGSQITDAIQASKIMLLIFSNAVNNSMAVQNEVFLAIESGVTVLPFRIENIEFNEELRYHLNRLHWLNGFPPPVTTHMGNLIDSVKTILMTRETRRPYKPPRHDTDSPAAQQKPALKRNLIPWVVGGGISTFAVLAAILFVVMKGGGAPPAVPNPSAPQPAPQQTSQQQQPQPAPPPAEPVEQPARQPTQDEMINYLDRGSEEGTMPTTLQGATIIETRQLDTALRKRDAGEMEFALIDALGCADHESIPGAKCLVNDNVDSLQDAYPDKDAEIVIFCQGFKCPESFSLAKAAVSVGYTHIYWYRGGINAWKTAGFPMAEFSGN